MSLGDLFLTDITPAQEGTFPGMAHFAGSGPKGKKCADCQNWDCLSRPPGRCLAFGRLMHKAGPPVPPLAEACKYFELMKKARNGAA